MAEQKTTKVLTRRRKFIEVEIPVIRSSVELIADSVEQLKDKTIKLDLTRQLKGKSVEATVKIEVEKNKAVAHPVKIVLMPYFIRRMIRKRISYVEDSFETPSQENMIIVKPFLITRKRVSRVIRKTLRNRTKNWIKDYIAERKNNEIFTDIFSNKMQKSLSLMLKKTYPLSLCEIRVLEKKRPLAPEEVPKIEPKKEEKKVQKKIEEGLDQLKEIEEEMIKKAEQDIKETQEKAVKIEESSEEDKEKKAKKPRKKKESSEAKEPSE